MIEIIFRAKHLDNGEWVIGYYSYDNGHHFIKSIDDGYDYPVIPPTLGQYTGANDKNKKRIFNGDILRDRHRRQYEVTWDGQELRYILVNTLNACNRLNMYLDCMEDFEVIGNIHELEQKKINIKI